jgi:hypothetical protein
MPVMRAFAASLVLLSLALAAPALAAVPVVKATLRTSTPTPTVDDAWRWTVVVKDGKGRPIAAKMRLQLLLGTLVVGCWKGKAVTQCSSARAGTWIRFKGIRTGVLTWPAQSVGVRLTFQAVVVAGGKTLRVRAPVSVQPKTP